MVVCVAVAVWVAECVLRATVAVCVVAAVHGAVVEIVVGKTEAEYVAVGALAE